MKRLTAMLGLFAMSSPSLAARMALEPQNRMHAGVSMVDLDAFGVSAGLDSRLTRFVSIDVGGFVSLSPSTPKDPDGDTIAEVISTRHGLWVAPGVRIPHQYGDGLIWDVFVRGGFGALWAQDFSDIDTFVTNPGGLVGLDLLLRKDQVGVRISDKVFAYRAMPKVAILESWPVQDRGILSNQLAVEFVYQW